MIDKELMIHWCCGDVYIIIKGFFKLLEGYHMVLSIALYIIAILVNLS